MNKYTYDGIDYYYGSFKIKEYKIYYEYYFQNNQYYIYVYHYDDRRDYGIIHTNLKLGLRLLKEKLLIDYNKGIFPLLIAEDFKIYVKHETVLLDCKDNIAYHITTKNNINNILKDGLIPIKYSDTDVLNASKIIDKYKEKYNIRKSFYRTKSIFFHPEIDNDLLTYKDYYKDCVLLAVNIKGLSGYVASSGIGGFCLHEENDKVDKKNLTKWAKNYWKYSLPLKTYKKNNNIKTPYEFSEIIIDKKIKPERISVIGFWNENGNFEETNNFKFYLKDKYKYNYKEIFKLY